MQETVNLSDPHSPLRIEYSRDAMEQIRKRAREGLLAAPRVGMGVGGLLLGVRKGAQIRLLDSLDIPCSHSAGPAFDLTAEEKRESREMIAEAGAPDVSRKVGVIGWYCSKTRGDASLSQTDLNLYGELFPDPGHVAMVVRPNVVEPMRAAFYFRDENGAVVKAVECDVEEWRPEPVTESEAVEPERHAEGPLLRFAPNHATGAQDEISPAPEPAATARFEAPGSLRDTRLDAVSYAGPVASQAPLRPAAFSLGAASVGVPGRLPPRPRRRDGMRLVLPFAAALLAVGVAGFATREFWLPKPPLTLSSTELNGTLLIRWNPEALRGVDHASMYVNDGGQRAPSLIRLDRFQLNSGLLSYTPKSERVTAKLDAGEASAITAWFKPAPGSGSDASPAAAGPTSPKPQPPQNDSKAGR